MPHAPPCPFLACLEPPDLVSPWQAARPQRKVSSPADDCVPPQAGLLLGGGACAQAVVRGHLGLGGGPSPHLIPTLTSPFKPGLLPTSSPGWPQACIPDPAGSEAAAPCRTEAGPAAEGREETRGAGGPRDSQQRHGGQEPECRGEHPSKGTCGALVGDTD